MQLSNGMTNSFGQAIAIYLLWGGDTANSFRQAEADRECILSLISGATAVRSCIWIGAASAISTAEAADSFGQAEVDEDEERRVLK